MERDLHSPRLLCLTDTQDEVGDMTSFEMLVALEKSGWVWHTLPKKNKRAAVVKITRESEDTIVVAPKVLSGGMQRWHIKALATLQMTTLALVDRGAMELAHFKDEKCYAQLFGERPHDGVGLDGPAIAGPTGARDAE